MAFMRLDKYLVEMNQGSRSQVKEMAKKGLIHVNDQIEKKTERKIVPGKDRITVDGTVIAYCSYEYLMLYKPQGVVSAASDNLHKTVLDLILTKQRTDLFPVGRLDLDTEGLLLITNDGALAHRLLSPKKHVDKVYFARIMGTLPADVIQQFQSGIVLSDQSKTLPAKLVLLSESEADHTAEVELTIYEGKFHQVKRMFEAVGCEVTFLKRLSMGTLSLDKTLQPGEYRALTSEELEQLSGKQ